MTPPTFSQVSANAGTVMNALRFMRQELVEMQNCEPIGGDRRDVLIALIDAGCRAVHDLNEVADAMDRANCDAGPAQRQ